VAPVTFEAAPTLLIGNPVVVADDVRASAVAERITNMMQETFRANGFVETYDLRDVQTNQLEGRSPDSVSRRRCSRRCGSRFWARNSRRRSSRGCPRPAG
jgi:hypothetical protein